MSYAEETVEQRAQSFAAMGSNNLRIETNKNSFNNFVAKIKKPSQKLPTHGEPNSKVKTPDGQTEREYGPDGKAIKDTHYGHADHHPDIEIPHHHDWEWDGDLGHPGDAYGNPKLVLIACIVILAAFINPGSQDETKSNTYSPVYSY